MLLCFYLNEYSFVFLYIQIMHYHFWHHEPTLKTKVVINLHWITKTRKSCSDNITTLYRLSLKVIFIFKK